MLNIIGSGDIMYQSMIINRPVLPAHLHYSCSKLAHSVSLSAVASVGLFFATCIFSRLHKGSLLAWNLHSVTEHPIDLLDFKDNSPPQYIIG